MLKKELEVFLTNYKSALVDHTLEIPFFTYLKERYEEAKKYSNAYRVYTKMAECIEPAAFKTRPAKSICAKKHRSQRYSFSSQRY
jgi:hypothetical protein